MYFSNAKGVLKEEISRLEELKFQCDKKGLVNFYNEYVVHLEDAIGVLDSVQDVNCIKDFTIDDSR